MGDLLLSDFDNFGNTGQVGDGGGIGSVDKDAVGDPEGGVGTSGLGVGVQEGDGALLGGGSKGLQAIVHSSALVNDIGEGLTAELVADGRVILEDNHNLLEKERIQ